MRRSVKILKKETIKIRKPDGFSVGLFFDQLNNDKCARAGSDGDSSLHVLSAKARKLVVFTKHERLAVEIHNLTSHIAVATEFIELCSLRKLNARALCKRVIDNEVRIALTAVFSAMAVYMCALNVRIAASIYCAAHKACPQKDCEIIGTRIKCAVLKESVVARCKSVVEDNTISERTEASKLVESAENVQIC